MAQQNTIENIKEGRDQVINDNTLQDLLKWDGSLDIHQTINFDALSTGRPAIEMVIQALSSEVISKCRSASTMKGRNRTTGNITEDLDNEKFQLLVVYNAVISPDLDNKELQAKFNKDKAAYYIMRSLFLPGEIDLINSKVFELSGYKFDEDISENSSDVDL